MTVKIFWAIFLLRLFSTIFLDHGYTKKLENHLNSLSKFYHALDEDKNKVTGYYDMTTFFTVRDKTETLLTGSALLGMAKDVSDKMVLSKAEVT